MTRPCVILAAVLFLLPLLASPASSADQPNILWLTVEDIGPHHGCYGDRYATTPHLDEFASRSLLYLNAWSTAPVCAPARTTLISGMYPPSTGSEHMRSMVRLPEGLLTYPQYMREAGYFCINPAKEDYNIEKPGKVWDSVPRQRTWEELKENQPFMAVFNYTGTHESRIRTRPHEQVLDPARAPVPAYHPDTPQVRRDWAQYYDNITVMDRWFAGQLEQLEKSGLAEDTIVFYYGDHGSGMPRHKRWPYNSGLRVPLIVYVPEKFRHLAPADYEPGGKTDRIVGFIDMASTVISLAGKEPPEHMQGHAFMGRHEAEEQPYGFGFRGRMDERYDMVRVVRNKRYLYIRNYMPHKIYGQYIAFMFVTPTTNQWKELYEAGKLNEVQSRFWEAKPPEELYDLENDPDEIQNLVDSREHQAVLDELREAHRDWAFRIRDVGFLPEDELHNRNPALSPYELGHHPDAYPLEEILPMAEKAASLDPSFTGDLLAGLSHPDGAVRYWAAMGLLMRESDGVAAGQAALRKTLHADPSPNVRIIAAEALGRYGDESDLKRSLDWLITAADAEQQGFYVALLALNAIDALGEKAKPIAGRVAELPQEGDWVLSRGKSYFPNLIERILE